MSASDATDPPALVNGYRHGRVPRQVREQQLLDVAEEQFAMHGYGGASIEVIARLAGVSRPIVYDHFGGGKEGVYLACLRRARGELEQMILSAVASAERPREMLERGTSAYFEFVERRGQRWAVLFGGVELAGGAAEEIAELRFATVSRIRDLIAVIAPGADETTVDGFAHAISGSSEQVAKWWRANPSMTREQVVSLQVAFAWEGLRQLLPEQDR
ncbi:MAG TPA: TetR/AcrR family transcriptional regulator [Solirubrobacteraceae bacterium]|nr:TetR/AcrR family transcriptional regulator [Solirubrobacteraceae bacterium]